MSNSYSSAELLVFLEELSGALEKGSDANIHVLSALNHLLRLDNAEALFAGEAREKAVVLWSRLKASGIMLQDPPLLMSAAGAGSN